MLINDVLENLFKLPSFKSFIPNSEIFFNLFNFTNFVKNIDFWNSPFD